TLVPLRGRRVLSPPGQGAPSVGRGRVNELGEDKVSRRTVLTWAGLLGVGAVVDGGVTVRAGAVEALETGVWPARGVAINSSLPLYSELRCVPAGCASSSQPAPWGPWFPAHVCSATQTVATRCSPRSPRGSSQPRGGPPSTTMP